MHLSKIEKFWYNSIDDRLVLKLEQFFFSLYFAEFYVISPTLDSFPRVDKRKVFPCPNCNSVYNLKGTLTRHQMYECGQLPRFKCPYCDYRAKQKSNTRTHIRTRHVGHVICVIDLADKSYEESDDSELGKSKLEWVSTNVEESYFSIYFYLFQNYALFLTWNPYK